MKEFTIGEVARYAGIETSAIRYYESVGAKRFVVSRVFEGGLNDRLTRWVEKAGDKLVRVFQNDSFEVYALR